MSTAVKRARNWKPIFIEKLAEHGVVTKAAKLAGVGRTTVFNHRNSDAAFDAACIEAVHEAADMFEMEVIKRAIVGSKKIRTETVVFPDGRVKTTTIEENAKSDLLLMFQLKSMKPERYRDSYDFSKMVATLASAGPDAFSGSGSGAPKKAPGRKRSA